MGGMSAITRRMNQLRNLSKLRNGPGAALLPSHITRLHLTFAHKHNNGHAGPRKFWHVHLTSLKFHNPHIPIIVNRTRDQAAKPLLTIYMKRGAAATAAVLSKSEANAAAEAATAETAAEAEKPLALDDVPDSNKGSSVPKTAVAEVGSGDPWAHIASSTDGSAPAPPAQSGEVAVTINLRNVLSDDIWTQFVAKTGATMLEPSAEDVEEMERVAALEARGEHDARVQQARLDVIRREKAMLEKSRQEAAALKSD